MRVYVDSPDDVIEREADARGRITLGSEFGDKSVQIAILEVENDNAE